MEWWTEEFGHKPMIGTKLDLKKDKGKERLICELIWTLASVGVDPHCIGCSLEITIDF